eukprot:m.105981 g.105981  ORF g.105981 m.105981 type:complete len:614 (+) comp16888_c0_seq1:169-2010(+)
MKKKFVSTVFSVSFYAVLCVHVQSIERDPRHLQSEIQQIINDAAKYYNISFSASIAIGASATFDSSAYASSQDVEIFTDMIVVSAASGYNDHKLGTKVDTNSLYPAGSITKLYTAIDLLIAAEEGLIDLDEPVYKYIDPWHAKQNPPVPTLLQIWENNSVIQQVTSRQLLQMRSGLQDYKDRSLYEWTITHPNEDYLPIQYLETVNKSFLFPPQTGGCYTGTGYVMAGMALAAARGNRTWDALQQRYIFSKLPESENFRNTVFMGVGKCSQYENVVHQYAYKSMYTSPNVHINAFHKDSLGPNTKLKQSQNSESEQLRSHDTAMLNANVLGQHTSDGTPSTKPPVFNVCKPGTGGYYQHAAGTGVVLKTIHASNAEDCCTTAGDTASAAAWQYMQMESMPGGADGECTIFSQLHRGYSHKNATLGTVDTILDLEGFTDLYDYSALNGWTMGNIAVAPKDVVRFYQYIGTGKMLSPSSMQQLLHFLPLTVGYEPAAGTPYGLGVLDAPLRYPVPNTSSCHPPTCVCDARGCFTNYSGYGHPGLDWGSAIPKAGYVPSLKLSYALAFNSFMGHNTSMGTNENHPPDLFDSLTCAVLARTIAFIDPHAPQFSCAGS